MMNIFLYPIYLMIIPAIISFTNLQEKTRFITGSFTESGESGINVFDFDPVNGISKWISSVNAGPNPTYFCISKDQKLIYVINEVSSFSGLKGGGLTTLKYSGNFENIIRVNEISVPNGGPCFISQTPDNKYLLVANYGGGSVAVVKLTQNGIPEKVCDSILYNGITGKVSHAHMIASDPVGKRIYVTDLGLDRIMIYSIDKLSGKLISFSENGIPLPPGTGPRHFVFNRNGSRMYVMGELKSTVSVFEVSELKGLVLLQTISALSAEYKGKNSSADIHLSPSGEFLYGTNRGENSIVTFRVGKDGLLTMAGHSTCGGDWPRNFTLDPEGRFILVGNQKSGNISIFGIDGKSGLPSKTIQNIDLAGLACIRF
jgi:6-phosphogluconolactonase